MMNLFAVAIFVGAVVLSQGELTGEERDAAQDALYNPSSDPGSYGDMKLSPTQKAGLRNRVAMNNLAQRWPGGVIPYEIHPSLNSIANMIYSAAAQIANKTNNCIRWVPRTNQAKYVRMYAGGGCSSWVGMYGPGAQDLSLGLPGCAYIGTVVHEMLHAVGFDHEQNRPDRDQYLNIYRQNIMQGQEHNFNTVAGGRTYSPFDFNSVMLYGEYAFSANRQPTMQDKTGQHRLTEPYDKQGMSPDDVFEVKTFYGCK